jgi:hypothetical protein
MNATEHNALKAQYDAGIEDAVLGRMFGASSAADDGRPFNSDVAADTALRHWYAQGWDEGQRRKSFNALRAETLAAEERARERHAHRAELRDGYRS